MIPRWYSVQVASGCEKKVKATLEQRSRALEVSNRILEIAIPQTPEVKIRKDGKRKQVSQNSFPGYVLVKLILDEETMMAVKSTPNVISFVGAEEKRTSSKVRGHIKPRPLSTKEVNRIFNTKPQKLELQDNPLTEGDPIIIIDGPFKDFKGEVTDTHSEQTKIKALISIFGRDTSVEIERSQVALEK